MIANILSIAGSDPSGGAGIQADLKTFSARGTYGMAVITALTAQNTHGVCAIHLPPASFVHEQIRQIFADVRVDAVKIGMIANVEIAQAVAEALLPHAGVPVVLDPVMIAKGGSALLQPDAIETLKECLLPLARLATPNIPEAARLAGRREAENVAEMEAQARILVDLGATAALVKGGHLDGPESPDVLVGPGGTMCLEGRRIHTGNTHGTGCSLSSAIAAEFGKGLSDAEAVVEAKNWLTSAIAAADQLDVGSGHGPIHHFHNHWIERTI